MSRWDVPVCLGYVIRWRRSCAGPDSRLFVSCPLTVSRPYRVTYREDVEQADGTVTWFDVRIVRKL